MYKKGRKIKIQPYLWHILVNLADKSLWKRRLQQKEKVDVVFISNFRDDVECQKYVNKIVVLSEYETKNWFAVNT